MDKNNMQLLFFQQIKDLLPAHLAVADEVAHVLEISRDSAYRRLRGEKPLTFEDLRKLCSRFKISLDKFLHEQSDCYIFSGTLAFPPGDFSEQYMQNMLQQFDFIRGFDDCHIYILPNEIPPFVYFQFPELAAFTFFYYRRSLLNTPGMKEAKFSLRLVDPGQVKLGKKVQDSFNKLPSTEIWGSDIINGMLRHISFYRDTMVFESKDDMYCIYNQLLELISHVEKQATLGHRFTYGSPPSQNPASFRMFYNDVITGDNCVLAKIGNSKITYINHNLINFMFTRDENFNNYTLDTFENAIQKSTQISVVGEKTRSKFFDQLRMKIMGQINNPGPYQ
jgi:hypothetical protein